MVGNQNAESVQSNRADVTVPRSTEAFSDLRSQGAHVHASTIFFLEASRAAKLGVLGEV